MGSAVFTFTDLYQVEDDVIKEIIKSMPRDEISKALNRERIAIRKRFHENWPSSDDWEKFKELIKGTDVESSVRIKMQEKMLGIIAKRPEYAHYRFQSRFTSYNNFSNILNRPIKGERPYGFVTENVGISSYFNSDKGEQMLSQIKQKNKEEGHKSFAIPRINIQFINYSVCPKCSHIYSYNDLLNYYMKPKLDSAFKQGMEAQLRQDTRMFCAKCKNYFLPSLLIMDGIKDGVVKNEVQFLSKMQTLNAIEEHFQELGYSVLTRDDSNLLKKDGVTIRESRSLKEDARNSFIIGVLNTKSNASSSMILKGIHNDIFLKELESKPMIICNLLQYSNTMEIALNLIMGINVEKGDVLFGLWL